MSCETIAWAREAWTSIRGSECASLAILSPNKGREFTLLSSRDDVIGSGLQVVFTSQNISVADGKK